MNPFGILRKERARFVTAKTGRSEELNQREGD